MVTLTGINTVNGTPMAATNSPTLDTAIVFQTAANSAPVPQTCETITPLTQASILTSYKLQDYLNVDGFLYNLKRFQDALEGADQLQTIPQTSSNNDAITYLDDLETRQMPVLELVQNCLAEKYVVDQEALDAQKQLTDESKDRLTRIQHPERETSYYEGWFPIFRPLQEVTLFALFGVALAFLVLSIYLFLRLSDVEFNVTFGSAGGGFLGSLPSFSEFGPYLGGGLAVGLIGGLIAGYVAYK